MNMQIYNWI